MCMCVCVCVCVRVCACLYVCLCIIDAHVSGVASTVVNAHPRVRSLAFVVVPAYLRTRCQYGSISMHTLMIYMCIEAHRNLCTYILCIHINT